MNLQMHQEFQRLASLYVVQAAKEYEKYHLTLEMNRTGHYSNDPELIQTIQDDFLDMWDREDPQEILNQLAWWGNWEMGNIGPFYSPELRSTLNFLVKLLGDSTLREIEGLLVEGVREGVKLVQKGCGVPLEEMPHTCKEFPLV